MSYQVLARKWRPGKFSELVGQEHVVSAISNALDNDRLHHAYLFTGTRGVGKTTIARIFSKSLNCEEGQGANPCGQCNTCKEIEQGNYVDLLEIDAASRTKVEDTRELLDNVQYKPTRGRYKVYLIDEVHMLSKHSFNALLKTLEEPPPHVKFLLATTDPQKLPITILSRCLQFNLKAMSREQIVGQLSHILEREQLPFEPQALALLARAAQGSMRDALSLTDQAIAQGGNKVIASVVTDMLGLMDKNQLLKVIHAVVNKSPADVLQLVNDIAEQAPDYDNVHSELGSLLHQVALTQWVPEACKLETTSAKAIYQLAKSIPAEQVQLLYQIALQGRKDLPYSADGKSALEMTLMRMMTFAPASPVSNTSEIISSSGSEHTLPVQQASPSGGPGNVSKQKEAPLSETSATHEQISTPENAEPHDQSEAADYQSTSAQLDDAHSTTVNTESDIVDEFEQGPSLVEQQPASPDVSKTAHEISASAPTLESAPVAAEVAGAPASTQTPEPTQALAPMQTPVSNAPTPLSEVAAPASEATGAPVQAASSSQHDVADDRPPLDAYMDDMPPLAEEGGFYGYEENYTGNGNTVQDNRNASDGAINATQGSSPEEQLTTTADMLALRQKLKQRKAQDAQEKAKPAASSTTSASSVLGLQGRARQATTNNSLENVPEQTADNQNTSVQNADNQSPDNQSVLGQQGLGQSSQNEAQETEQPEPIEAVVSSEQQPNESPLNDNLAQDDMAQGSMVEYSNTQPSGLNSTSNGSSSEGSSKEGNASADEFIFDEFDADAPFSNDDVADDTASLGAVASAESTSPNASNAVSTSSSISASDDAFHEARVQEASAQPEHAIDHDHDNHDTPPWAFDNEPPPFEQIESTPEQTDSGYYRDALDFDAPLSATYDGNLKAYLDDGNKLTHASQIDEWSHLVEQLPVAGLLKQLVLHAAFSRNGNAVSLEIDHSQAHLLNDSTKKQLIDALHHGLGEGVTIDIKLGEPSSTPFTLQQEIHAMRHAHAHTVINTDDTIQTLMSTFDASVLTDTVKAR
ncbi:hypothetical protein KUL42_43250 [Alteromonas sp. KUL42]|uniref:DNA polymerase III subunit gamma/tau n=1 Tax=Alteromonas sp. KUL42 TaxID=2480797 RepID=UPI001035D45C|nr:DNA polymerase III subunit gamma/tau [Alteromonas sp. KUL42]TAP30492.1 DNA polymerase III subunit gamma/tau [Alteromonas sp. KUL42]GEA09564.1 hypothetical protein KUL42_43250 [Alteromonas sp. KUL42]